MSRLASTHFPSLAIAQSTPETTRWITRRSGAPGSGSASPGSAAAGSANWGSAPAAPRPARSRIIHQAMGLGVNLFDTAAAYGTEAVLGKAIKSMPRDQIVVCTKAPFSWSSGRADPQGIVASLDNSLRQLDTDYIDVYQLHGVPPANYDHALNSSPRRCCARRKRANSAISGSPRPRPTTFSTTCCTAPPPTGCGTSSWSGSR